MSATSAAIVALDLGAELREAARSSPPSRSPARFDDQVPTKRPSTVIVGRTMPPPGMICSPCRARDGEVAAHVAEVVVVERAEQADDRRAQATAQRSRVARSSLVADPTSRSSAAIRSSPSRQSRSGSPAQRAKSRSRRRRRTRGCSGGRARRASPRAGAARARRVQSRVAHEAGLTAAVGAEAELAVEGRQQPEVDLDLLRGVEAGLARAARRARAGSAARRSATSRVQELRARDPARRGRGRSRPAACATSGRSRRANSARSASRRPRPAIR